MMTRLKTKIKEIFFDDILEKENEINIKSIDELNQNNKKLVIKSGFIEHHKTNSVSSMDLPKKFQKIENKPTQLNGITFSK